MQALGNKHLDFVPGKMIDQDEKTIFVFSRLINRRVYKEKKRHIGYITFHVKSRAYAFYPVPNICIGWESAALISRFIFSLQKNLIEFKPEKGELITYDQKTK